MNTFPRVSSLSGASTSTIILTEALLAIYNEELDLEGEAAAKELTLPVQQWLAKRAKELRWVDYQFNGTESMMVSITPRAKTTPTDTKVGERNSSTPMGNVQPPRSMNASMLK